MWIPLSGISAYAHARRLWNRYCIPPASADALIHAIEHGAHVQIDKRELPFIMERAQELDRLPCVRVQTVDGWCVVRRCRMNKRKA